MEQKSLVKPVTKVLIDSRGAAYCEENGIIRRIHPETRKVIPRIRLSKKDRLRLRKELKEAAQKETK